MPVRVLVCLYTECLLQSVPFCLVHTGISAELSVFNPYVPVWLELLNAVGIGCVRDRGRVTCSGASSEGVWSLGGFALLSIGCWNRGSTEFGRDAFIIVNNGGWVGSGLRWIGILLACLGASFLLKFSDANTQILDRLLQEADSLIFCQSHSSQELLLSLIMDQLSCHKGAVTGNSPLLLVDGLNLFEVGPLYVFERV